MKSITFTNGTIELIDEDFYLITLYNKLELGQYEIVYKCNLNKWESLDLFCKHKNIIFI
jgi:hypothetical protein